MKDVLVTKIIETEKDADEIIENAKTEALNLVEKFIENFRLRKKQIEDKYDEDLFSSQELIDKEFNQDFENKLQDKKIEIDKMKIDLEKDSDKVLNFLFSGESDNGNS